MYTIKTIAAAVVVMIGIFGSSAVVANPSSSAEGISSQSVVNTVKKKKRYKKKEVAATPSSVENKTEDCFWIFCNNASAPSEEKVLSVAAKYDGYTARDNRKELKTFLSQPFDRDIDPMQIAWCAAFVNAVLHYSGYVTTDSLMARSFLRYGQKTSKPEKGDIVVLTRGRSRETGHVGFFVGYDETRQYVIVMGGNQGKMVTTAYYPVSRILGFRKPVLA